MDFVYFVVLVGVLIFVHELGHFAWAKIFGVKVLKFSLGFGPTLVGVRRGETDYVIAALPLGGYVRMLGEHPEDVIGEGDRARSFQAQALWKRVIIVFAGPAMNLIFPVVLYFVVFLGDSTMAPPVIGRVFPDRPADAHLLPGDRVVAIDGEEIESFYAMNRIVEASAGIPLRFEIERGAERLVVTLTPERAMRERPLELTESVGRIGVMANHPLAVLGVVSPESPAAAARLQSFDVVIAAGGRRVEKWLDLVGILDVNRGALLPLTYLRPVRVGGALGGLIDLHVYEPHVAAITPDPGPNSGVARAGVELADLYVAEVRAGSAEHLAGVLPGDRLEALDGVPIRAWATFLEDLRAGGGREHILSWRRGGREMSSRFRLTHERGVTDEGQTYDRYAVGMTNWLPSRVDATIPNPHPVAYAFSEAVRSTAEVVELTVISVVRLLQGRLSMKTLGGPLTIFDFAGTAAREGALNYLTLMAFISINLGLINLVPIPLLDGGHLLFFAIESIARRPMSARAREYASLVGLTLLLFLMVFALKNDLERQWPEIVDVITEE